MSGYIGAVTPLVGRDKALVKVFVESSIVLSVAYLEELLKSLVGQAGQPRSAALREYLANRGTESERFSAKDCEMPDLVRMAKRRLSFKKRGAEIDRLFRLLYGWDFFPSDSDRTVIVDFVLVRNLIVHEGSTDVGLGKTGALAAQLSRSDLLTVRRYQDYAVYHLDHLAAAILLRDAMVVMKGVASHMRTQALNSNLWD